MSTLFILSYIGFSFLTIFLLLRWVWLQGRDITVLDIFLAFFCGLIPALNVLCFTVISILLVVEFFNFDPQYVIIKGKK